MKNLSLLYDMQAEYLGKVRDSKTAEEAKKWLPMLICINNAVTAAERSTSENRKIDVESYKAESDRTKVETDRDRLENDKYRTEIEKSKVEAEFERLENDRTRNENESRKTNIMAVVQLVAETANLTGKVVTTVLGTRASYINVGRILHAESNDILTNSKAHNYVPKPRT